MKKKIFALLLIPFLAASCVRVKQAPDQQSDPNQKPMVHLSTSARALKIPTMC